MCVYVPYVCMCVCMYVSVYVCVCMYVCIAQGPAVFRKPQVHNLTGDKKT